MYEYQTEIPVLPNGLTTSCSRPNAGSTADIGIFQENMNWHKKRARKRNSNEFKTNDDKEYYKNFKS